MTTNFTIIFNNKQFLTNISKLEQDSSYFRTINKHSFKEQDQVTINHNDLSGDLVDPDIFGFILDYIHDNIKPVNHTLYDLVEMHRLYDYFDFNIELIRVYIKMKIKEIIETPINSLTIDHTKLECIEDHDCGFEDMLVWGETELLCSKESIVWHCWCNKENKEQLDKFHWKFKNHNVNESNNKLFYKYHNGSFWEYANEYYDDVYRVYYGEKEIDVRCNKNHVHKYKTLKVIEDENITDHQYVIYILEKMKLNKDEVECLLKNVKIEEAEDILAYPKEYQKIVARYFSIC